MFVALNILIALYLKKMASTSRFGDKNQKEIDNLRQQSVPINTIKSKKSIWKQFKDFCEIREYILAENTSTSKLAEILEDWAANMRTINGDDYKEYSVKTIWNMTAKMLEEKYFHEYNIKFNPFSDIEFQKARQTRDAKRKSLQVSTNKRKQSSVALNKKEFINIINTCDEKCPIGLQKKLFFIISYELAWKEEKALDAS